MGDIKAGDEVLGADGKPTRVTFATDIMYDRPCYEVSFSTGETIIADEEHLWEVTDEYTKKTKVLTTGDMLKVPMLVNNKNQARFSIKTTKPLDLPDQQLVIDPYVLGVWLGDGSTNSPVITNHVDDIFIIDEVKRYYTSSSQYSNHNNNTTQNYYFKQLRSDLKTVGVFGKKNIPINYLRASVNQRLALLQGLMDTDGYVNEQTGGCELTLTCKQLTDDAAQLINSLGFKCSTTCRKINGKTPHVRWTIWFTPYRSQFAVFRLPRKLDKMKQLPSPTRLRSTQKRSIQSITPIDSVPVRCITVDNEDHLYLVGPSFIPTHNTATSMAYLLWYAMFNFEKTILIASNKNDNAMECIYRIRFMYERLPHWLKPGLTDDGWNKHSVGFDNASRILSVATSENSGRGFAISLLYCDEFAFVRDTVQQEFWTSMAPTLATGGSCIITSTPNGDANIFAQLWRGANIPQTADSEVGSNGFLPIEVKWDEPPGRDAKFREEEIAKIGELRWKQEYECCRANTLIEIQDETNNIFHITIGELHHLLLSF
ncbi:MAG: hypothetical protein CTY12_00065 [Methylotenera sp.]|nr:MAG: hypothetical protein CTY12_00065 [Methylotenera sp.]